MATIAITYANKRHKSGSIKLNNFSRRSLPQLRKAIREAGNILESGIKRKLSGPSHTRFPGASNAYPGVLSGRLRASVTSKITDGGLTVTVGPNTKYAARHEFGYKQTPERKYVQPTMDENVDKITDIVFNRVTRTLA